MRGLFLIFIVLEKKSKLGTFVTQILSHFVCALLLAFLSIYQSAASANEIGSADTRSVSSTDFSVKPVHNSQQFDDRPLEPSIKGSLCLVRSDDRLLLVDEILTGKLSLPGGTIENNENPRLTAQRETWEEAGLVVNVGREVGRTEHAVFYECQVESDIIAYSESNFGRGVELPIYFAPHFGVEIRSAYLLAPKSVIPREYRYPKQWPLVKQMYAMLDNQPVNYVENLIESAPGIHQIELFWLASTQQALIEGPAWIQELVLLGGNLVYLLVQPLLLIAFLPLFIWLWGRHFMAQLMFAVAATSLFILVAKQGFGFPVPHAYLPTINYSERSGFSFPDLMMANWICISTIVVSQINARHIAKFSIFAFLVTVLLAFYQFMSGGAFLSDMFVGAIIGASVAWHFIRHHFSLTVSEDYTFTQTKVWVVLTGIAALITYIWQYPCFLSWLALCLGMLLFSVASSYCPPRSRMCLKELLTSLLLILVTLFGYFYLEQTISYSGLGTLILKTLVIPLMIAIPAVVMVIFRRTILK